MHDSWLLPLAAIFMAKFLYNVEQVVSLFSLLVITATPKSYCEDLKKRCIKTGPRLTHTK